MTSSLAAQPRRRPGVEEQRRVITAAAVGLFATRGSAATPIADICRAAAVSRDTFYRCFRDKEELIDHLYRTAVDEHILAVLDASDLDYANQAWLHRVFGQTIDSILEHHDVARFLYVESADPASPAYTIINEAYDKVSRRMQHWCRKHYGKAPSREYFRALLAAVQWLVHNAINQGLGPREVGKAKAAAEQLFHAAFTSLEVGAVSAERGGG